ncbi:alpha-tectorin-like [Leptodactylus fuscus]
MRTWTCFLGLLLGSTLYPFGESHNDYTTDLEDDGGTDKIELTHSFTFFGEIHRSLYVNNNGAISFKGPVTAYTPDAFPLSDFCMICPFWADADNECGGLIYYRQTVDEIILKRLSEDIRSAFTGLDFTAHWAFIATWDNVAYHGTESNKTNTFQCVLAADGYKSVAIFNYHDIQWTTGTASGGDPKTGLGGYAAQAGFNTGTEYFNMPLSRTEHMKNIHTTSNVGIPGCWMFQVDHLKAPGGCIHQDSFLSHGQIIWSDESCNQKCSCKHNGKVECHDKPCDEGLVCQSSGRHFLCQIDEEDC